MRSLLVLPLALLMALLLAMAALVGCNESDPEALYIDVLYQMRCLDCEPRTNDGPVRDIHHLDGDQGFDLGCELSDASDGTQVSFFAEYTDVDNESNNYSIEIDQVGLGDSANGPRCSVKVLDSGTTYEGSCVATDDNPDPPCSVSLKKEKGVIRGSVSCNQIPVQDMREPIRYLYKPGSSKSAPIEIRGCDGV